MNQEKVIKIINEKGLKPATKRDLPLLVLSIIGDSYRNGLKKEVGFSYDAVAALGDEKGFQTFFNSDDISVKTEKYLKKEKDIYAILKKAKRWYFSALEKIRNIQKNIKAKPTIVLEKILGAYAEQILSLGLANCYLRYIGDNKTKAFAEKPLENIAKTRNMIADLYPKIEDMIRLCTHKIGKKEGFDGGLLRFLTQNELKEYFKRGFITVKEISKAKERKKGYLYIYHDEEIVITEHKILIGVEKSFFTYPFRGIIKGKLAYKGHVRGTVFNFSEGKKPKGKGFILVTYMTQPHHLSLMHKAKAVVTDEGGLLSHAAILARELKKPCIIGTKIATKVLKTGDYVEVDASKGVVRKIR